VAAVVEQAVLALVKVALVVQESAF